MTLSVRRPKLPAVLAFLALLWLAAPPLALAEDDQPKVPHNAYSKVVRPDLAAPLQQQGEIRVVVGLQTPAEAAKPADSSPDKVKEQAVSDRQTRVLQRLAGHNVRNLKRLRQHQFMAVTVDAAGLSALLADPEVTSVTEDRVVHPSLLETPAIIHADTAWAAGARGAGQVIAIIDTGVDKTHPFLSGKVVAEACYSNPNGSTNQSYCPTGTTQSTATDSGLPCPDLNLGCWHGTHVAGIAAGKSGVLSGGSGIAPDANLISIQVFQYVCSTCQLNAYDSDILLALDHVYSLRTTYTIVSVNMSLGGDLYTGSCDGSLPAYKTIIDNLRNANIATVVASGNNSATNAISAPACISSAISVGSTTKQNTISGYSNSANILKLLAPGTSVISSLPYAVASGGFGTASGTSMATPHVAGAWAVIRSAKPSATVNQMLSAFQSTGLPITDSRNGIVKPLIQIGNTSTHVGALGAITGIIAPSVTLTTPTDNAMFTVPGPVNLSAAASDLDGVVTKVEFYRDATLIATVTTPSSGTTSSGTYTFSDTGLPAGNYSYSAKVYDNATPTLSATSAAVMVSVTAAGAGSVNVASQANGGVATASSTFNNDPNYGPTGVNNGDRKGANWGSGGGWIDYTQYIYPDWLQIDFGTVKSIGEIDVFSIQDNYAAPAEPTSTMTFTQYGITAFQVQYWNGNAWMDVPGGNVTGNTRVWRRFAFAPISTDRIRVLINAASSGNSLLAEVEAWTPGTGIDTSAPSVPGGLSSSAVTATGATISWTASSDNVAVTGYKVFRDGVQVGTPSGTLFTDTGLSGSTTYSYTVSAFDAAGNNSGLSSPLSVTTAAGPDTTPPSAPTGLSSSAVTTTGATISWTASTDNVAVTGYKVFRDGVQVGTPAGTSFADSGLTASTTYSYTVSAFDAAGNNSALSNPLSVTTASPPDTTPPSAPTGLSSSSVTATGATISWTASTDNVAVTGYKVFRDGVQKGTPAGTSFTDTGLTASTAYSYTVSAFDAAGNNSTLSNPLSVTTAPPPDVTPPSAPTNLSASAVTGTAATISWTASSDNVAVTGYKVFRDGVQKGTPAGTSFTDTGLTASTTYSYTISAFDLAGNNSALSNPLPVTTSPINYALQSNGGVATASTTLSANHPPASTNNGDRKGTGWGSGGGWADATQSSFPDSVQITFNGVKSIGEIDVFSIQDNYAAPVEPTGTMTFTQYGITAFQAQYWTGSAWADVPGGNVTGNNLVWRKITFTPVSTDRIRVLINASVYPYSLLAEIEAWSVSTDPDTTPPSAPTGLASSAVTATGATISWTASTDNVAVTGYKVFRDGVQVGTPVGTSFADSGLTGSTTYSYTVSAFDAAGNNSALSNPLSVTTAVPPDTTPPSTPTGLSSSAVTASGATISWTASTDNVAVTGYKVFRDGVQVGTPVGTSFNDSGLAGSTTYNYTVSAFDAAGNNSALSSPLPVTTPAGADTTPPSTPTGLSSSAVTSTGATISWIASSDDVAVTGYKVFRDGVQKGTPAGTSFTDTGLTASTTYGYTISAFDAAGNNSTLSNPLSVTTASASSSPINVALQANGGVATASTSLGANYPPAALNNGDRKGTGWGSGGGWADATQSSFPDSVQITFNGVKSIGEIDVFSIQDNYAAPVEPTGTMTFTQYGITAFQAQYWTGSAWADVPGGNVTGNNLVWRKITFTPVSTDRIRVLINASVYPYSLLAEIEAWTGTAGPDATPPSAPTNLASSAVTTTSATISWTASTDNVGVTGYKVFRDGVQAGTPAGTSFADSGLTASTTYNYTVSAFDAAGNNSPLSNPLPVTTAAADGAPPSVPANLSASAVTATSATISWTASTDDVAVTGYKVFRDGVQKGTPAGTSFTDTGLTASTTYGYTISAFDAAGNNSTLSNPLSVTTASASSSPINVALQANGGVATASTSLGANYPPAALNNGDRKGTGWGSGGGWADATQSSFPDSVQITFNGVKSIGEIDVFSIQDNYAAPVEPTGTMTFTQYGITAFQAQYWTGSAWADVPGGNVTGNNLVWRKITFTPVSTDRIRVLINASVYPYSLLAEIEAWTGTAGPDATPPSAPTNLASSAVTTTSATISWTASTDNVGVTGYKVFRDGVQAGTPAGTSFADSGLTASTTYNYTVSAFDAAGNNSPLSNPLPVTTAAADGAPPSVPANLSASAVTAMGATVSWTASTDNIAVTGYKVFRDGSQVGTAAGTSFTDDGLAASTSYSYTVSAFDAAGNNSAPSSPLPVTTVAPSLPTLTLQSIASGFTSPVGINHAGDGSGRLFVVQQSGQIRIVSGGSVLPTAFLDIAGLIAFGGEQGLLGLAFHPNYASNGFFYLNYTRAGDGATVIVRYQRSASDQNIADPGSATILLSVAQPFSNHNGGQLRFGPDGYLYIGLGDGGSGNDPGNRAQDLSTLLGKMLRIDVNSGSPYAIPPDNPYQNDGNPATLAEIWAYGLRNPWRFSFDRSTGGLFIADVGQSAREEINFVPAGTGLGANFGWRVMEGNQCTGLGGGPACGSPSFTAPVLDYGHDLGCSITGGHRYRGPGSPAMTGYFIYGDYCSGRIWGATQSTTWTTTQLLVAGFNISTFGEDEAGEIYVAAYNTGTIYRVNAQ